MKKRYKDSDDNESKWLCTFNDMMNLLLTFFILILSMSKLDVGKVKEAVYSINVGFGVLNLGKKHIEIFRPFVLPIENRHLSFEERKRRLATYINRIDNMHAEVTDEGVSVRLKEKLFFKTGMAEIQKKNYPSLKKLCSILQRSDCQIRVEGHTDDIPIDTERFPSNWELSVARAVNVVKYFISKGNISPERLSAAGYGDSRPLYPNVNDHNRELNRRVEIILILKRDQQRIFYD